MKFKGNFSFSPCLPVFKFLFTFPHHFSFPSITFLSDSSFIPVLVPSRMFMEIKPPHCYVVWRLSSPNRVDSRTIGWVVVTTLEHPVVPVSAWAKQHGTEQENRTMHFFVTYCKLFQIVRSITADRSMTSLEPNLRWRCQATRSPDGINVIETFTCIYRLSVWRMWQLRFMMLTLEFRVVKIVGRTKYAHGRMYVSLVFL
jgi:hypothetical protein